MKEAVTASQPEKAAEPEKAPQPVQKAPVRRGRIDLSLGAALSKQSTQGTQRVQETVRQRTSEVTEDDIKRLWNSFPAQIREMRSLHFVFTKLPVWSAENKTITVELDSRLVAEELGSILPRLTKYMRDGLQNDTVSIETRVTESRLSSRDLTPKGKAKAMAEKNEKLRDLCRRLHLDFV